MDSLTQLQLTILETGGNSQLYNFLNFYDLVQETVQRRYYTRAAEFYRQKLKELSEKGASNGKGLIDFTQFNDKPSYEEGRVYLQISQSRFNGEAQSNIQ